jgi:predicted MFS family arabinose efflux permease
MTAATLALTPAATTRPRLVTGPLLRLLVADTGGLTGFYLLLSVVPLYATSTGVGGVGAGLATGALMLSTVAAECVTAALVARFGYRAVLAAGLLLLGVPALALPLAHGLGALLAISLLRGLGLGILFVVCGALGAQLVPADRRGEGVGMLGAVAGMPAIVAMPLGLWVAGSVGFTAVFVAGGVVALLGLVAVPGLPGRRAAGTADEALGLAAGLRNPGLLRPAIVFAATATAAGIVATFLPAAVGPEAGALAGAGLLVQSVAGTVARWWAGRLGDRHGAARLLAPGAILTAAGMLTLLLVGSPVATLVGMVLFGTGFGVVQTASMAVMLDRVSAAGFGTVSALWSIAYDAGFGAGAIGFGFLAGWTGYPIGFAVTAAVVLVALPLTRGRALTARRHRR